MENNDIAGALGKLLNDPAALASVMNMANSLMGNLQAQSDTANKAEAQGVQEAELSSKASPAPDISGNNESQPLTTASAASNASSSTEPGTMSPASSLAALAPLLAGGGKSDPRCALLYALKPYMGHGREDKIDTLVNILRIADMAGGLLGGKLF